MKTSRVTFLLIVAFGFLVRAVWIGALPPSLNWDEVSLGYNAYSILKTGADEWGKVFPAIFRAYGDYKLPVYIYLTAISELFFGLSVFAVRLPSLLAGTSLIVFTYQLAGKVFKDRKVALFSALLVVIEPWSLFFSRAALEANVAIALIVSGVYFLIVGIEKRSCCLPLGVLLLGLSVWTYNSARVFVPLLLFVFAAIYRSQIASIKKNTFTIVSGVLLILFFVPMFVQLGQSSGMARYANLQLVDAGAVGKIIEMRESSPLPSGINRLVFNRATFFLIQFAGNYAKHFSPGYLFLRGGDNYQFSVPGWGLLYAVNAPFFAVGLVKLARKYLKRKNALLLIAWFLLAPIASSITTGSPHALRAIVMLPIPMMLSAVGVKASIDRFSRLKWMFAIYIIAVIISFADYANFYVKDYRKNYSWVWQYGYEQAVGVIRNRYHNYEKIVITKKYGEPHEFVLFYFPWEPAAYQEQDKIRYFQSNWYWVDRFDKFYFVNDWDIPEVGSSFRLESGDAFECASCLLVTSPGNAPENWRKIETISFLDGEPAFEIYEH